MLSKEELTEKYGLSDEQVSEILAGKDEYDGPDWESSVEETCYLMSIPGMSDKIQEGQAEPLENCVTADDLDWCDEDSYYPNVTTRCAMFYSDAIINGLLPDTCPSFDSVEEAIAYLDEDYEYDDSDYRAFKEAMEKNDDTSRALLELMERYEITEKDIEECEAELKSSYSEDD